MVCIVLILVVYCLSTRLLLAWCSVMQQQLLLVSGYLVTCNAQGTPVAVCCQLWCCGLSSWEAPEDTA